MSRFSLLVALLAVWIGAGAVPDALGQGKKKGAGKAAAEIETLKKEIESLKREIDLLKRENDLLKTENASLKKGETPKSPKSTGSNEAGEAVGRVTAKNVEYVWQGITRSGAIVTATVLATSKDGVQPAPKGSMILVDAEGTKYTGRPAGMRSPLREGVPVKLSWQFGGKAFGGIDPTNAPSARITRFAGVFIGRTTGRGDTIDFRNVPAVMGTK